MPRAAPLSPDVFLPTTEQQKTVWKRRQVVQVTMSQCAQEHATAGT
jgi:hypothetical protein